MNVLLFHILPCMAVDLGELLSHTIASSDAYIQEKGLSVLVKINVFELHAAPSMTALET